MLSKRSDWVSRGICYSHHTPHIWLSSDISEIREAANICNRCPVKMDCLYNAIYETEFVGVRGGITEYEYLSKTWVEVEDDTESNWPKTDSIIQRLLREYA